MSAVQVVVRVRPFNTRELEEDEVFGNDKALSKDTSSARQRTSNFDAPKKDIFSRSVSMKDGKGAPMSGRKSYSGLPSVEERVGGRKSYSGLPSIPVDERRKSIPLGTKSRVCVAMDAKNTVSVLDPWNGYAKEKTFQFDGALWSATTDKTSFAPDVPFADQEHSYKVLCSSLVDNVVTGYNNCLFAYGQTGSGKTFTMMGSTADDDPNRGVIPRLCEELINRMQHLRETRNNYSFSISVSFLEVYMEKVYDLLLCQASPRASNAGMQQELRVRQHPQQGVYVEGITEVEIFTYHEMLDCIKKGNNVRHTASTRMNDKSSRSHSIFTIHFNSLEMLHEADRSHYGGLQTNSRSSKLNLVDLAGSEITSKSGVEGVNFTEATKINLSLTTLGRVIDALSEMSKKLGRAAITTPPYRDSMLTFLLSDSLGGNSKTTMVATISPHFSNFDETVNTLRYASRAREIVNVAVVNEDPSIRRIRELTEENERLKKKLIDNRDRNVAGNVEMQSEHINLRAAHEALQEEAKLVIEALFDAPVLSASSPSCSPARPTGGSMRNIFQLDSARSSARGTETRTLRDCLLPIRILKIDRENALKEKDKALKDASKASKSTSDGKVKKKEVAAANKALNAVEDDLADAKKRIRDVEKELTQQRAKAKAAKADLDAANKQVKVLEKTVDKKQAELEEHRSVYVSLEKKNNKLAKALETVSSDTKNKAAAMAANQTNAMQVVVDQKTAEAEKLQTAFEKIEKENAEIEERHQERMRDLQAQFEELKARMERQTAILSDTQLKNKEHVDELGAREGRIEAMVKEATALRAELATVKQTAEGDLAALRTAKGDEIMALKAELAMSQTESKQKQAEYDTLQVALMALEGGKSAADSEIGKLQQSLAAQQATHQKTMAQLGELGAVKDTYGALQASHAELAAEHGKLQTSYTEEHVKNTRLEEVLATQQASHAALESAHNALQSAHNSLEKEHENVSSAFADVSNRLSELNSKLQQTSMTLEETAAEKERMVIAQAEAEKRAAGLSEKVDSLDKENVDLRQQAEAQAEEARQRILALEQQMKDLREQKEQLNMQQQELLVKAGVLQSHKAELEAAQQSLSAQLATTEACHKTAVAEAAKLKEEHGLVLTTKGQEIVSLKEATMTKEQEVYSLRERTAALEARLAEKEASLEKLMDQRSEMLLGLSSRQDDLLTEKTKVLELTAEVTKTREAAHTAEAKLAALEEEHKTERAAAESATREHAAVKDKLKSQNKHMRRALYNGVTALGRGSVSILRARVFHMWQAFRDERVASRNISNLEGERQELAKQREEFETLAKTEYAKLNGKIKGAKAQSGKIMKKYAWMGHLLEREQRNNKALATQRLMLLDYAAGYADVHVKVSKLNTLLERENESLMNDKRDLEEEKATLTEEIEVKSNLVSVLRIQSEEHKKVAKAAEERAAQAKGKKKNKKEAIIELTNNEKLMLTRWEHEYQNLKMFAIQEMNTTKLAHSLLYLQFEQREYDDVMMQLEDQMEEQNRKDDVLLGKVQKIMEQRHVFKSLAETAEPVVGMEDAIASLMDLLATIKSTDLSTFDMQFNDTHMHARKLMAGGQFPTNRKKAQLNGRRGAGAKRFVSAGSDSRAQSSWAKLSQVVVQSQSQVNNMASSSSLGMVRDFRSSWGAVVMGDMREMRGSIGPASEGNMTPTASQFSGFGQMSQTSMSPRPDLAQSGAYYRGAGRPPLPGRKPSFKGMPLSQGPGLTPEKPRAEGAISFEEERPRVPVEDLQPMTPKSVKSEGDDKKDCLIM